MEAIFAAGLLATLATFVLIIVLLVAWVQGLVLAFRAHILLGILCLLVQVPLVLIGVIYWIFGFDIPAALVRALRS
ncbi:hypothetical protein KBI23_19395 [bacterium]|nr:hypothetical protein [bacterium]